MKFKHIRIILAAVLAVTSTGSLGVSAVEHICNQDGEFETWVEPTCTEPGYDGAKYCTICGKPSDFHYTFPATGHWWSRGTITVEPTTTSDGLLEYYCYRCSETGSRVIPKLAEPDPEPAPAPTPTPEPTPEPTPTPTWEKGDVNLDGKVNTDDATLILKHTLWITHLSGLGYINADVNGDGYINVADATIILKTVLGIE